REELERHAAASGVNGRVTFLGARSREEGVRTLAGAHAALLPSAWETLPHAAVEALAVGTPVVATAVGGVPEVVHDGENGLLVAAGRPDALAAGGGGAVGGAGARRPSPRRDGVRTARGAAAGGGIAPMSVRASIGSGGPRVLF